MRNLALISILCFLIHVEAVADDSRVAPDWTLPTSSGEAVTLSEAASEQPVILLFWATWCPYCKALMPHIQSIRLEYGEDVRVLALHFRDDKGDPVAFIKEAGYDFTLIPSSADVAKQYDVWATPGVLIVDAGMNVRFDLYSLPAYDLPAGNESAGHGRKAAYKAPYWAAAIRSSLDEVLASQADERR